MYFICSDILTFDFYSFNRIYIPTYSSKYTIHTFYPCYQIHLVPGNFVRPSIGGCIKGGGKSMFKQDKVFQV